MKKNLLSILMLALLVVNIALTVVMMLSLIGTNKKTAELVSNIATIMNLELTPANGETAETAVSVADTAFYDFGDQMKVVLKADENGKTSMILFEVALSLNTKHEDYETYGAGDLSAYKQILMGEISDVVSKYTLAECQGNFDAVKADILKALQSYFGSDFIYKVSISQVLFG